MNKIERAIYDVKLHIEDKQRQFEILKAQLITLEAVLKTLESIETDDSIPNETKQQEQAKAMEKEHLQTHKYTESDLISAFEYGWNQYGWNKQQYGIMDEDKIHRIQKRFIQSINELKQQEQ
jgi:hypothetical protein